MNEFVENDDVVFAEQRGDGADGGGVAGGKSQRGFRLLEGGERFLQFVQRRERTADEPRRAGTGTKFFHSANGGGFQRGMIGEAEVIVGGKIQERLAAEFDANPLRGIHAAQFAEQVLFAQIN